MKGLNMYIKDITKQVFLKNLGFTYLQYLQPNKSLRSLRIVGIYIFAGYTIQKSKKKSKRINIRIEYIHQRQN